jgi:hypothetical protein
MVVTSVIPALERLWQKDLQFKTSLGYLASFQTAWATEGDPVLKKQNKTTI